MRLRRRQRQRQRRQRLRKLSNKLRVTADGGVAEESREGKRATNTGTPRIEVGRKTSARVGKREREAKGGREGGGHSQTLTRLGNQFRFLCLFPPPFIHSDSFMSAHFGFFFWRFSLRFFFLHFLGSALSKRRIICDLIKTEIHL